MCVLSLMKVLTAWIMMFIFRIMKITLIDDKFTQQQRKFYQQLPKLGKQYTIRKILLQNNEYVLHLNEIFNNNMVITNTEPGFHYSRFSDAPNNVLNWETINQLYKKQML